MTTGTEAEAGTEQSTERIRFADVLLLIVVLPFLIPAALAYGVYLFFVAFWKYVIPAVLAIALLVAIVEVVYGELHTKLPWWAAVLFTPGIVVVIVFALSKD